MLALPLGGEGLGSFLLAVVEIVLVLGAAKSLPVFDGPEGPPAFGALGFHPQLYIFTFTPNH
jgi:hypothetical protein